MPSPVPVAEPGPPNRPVPYGESAQPTVRPRRAALHVAGFYLAIIIPIWLLISGLIVRLSYQTAFPYTPAVIVIVVLSQIGVIGSVYWSLFTLYGFIRFGAPQDRRPAEGWIWNPETLLIVAYVSRGDQPLALARSITTTRDLLERYGVRFEIEAVTDTAVPAEHRITSELGTIRYVVVPQGYETARRTRFKARALQYLLEDRTKRLAGREDHENLWILHLDEESTVTPESILGIAEFTSRHDVRRDSGVIGQGEILYNGGQYGGNPLLETADAVRTGDDLGRFRTQFKTFRKPIFGMHGSFVLVPGRIEREISWDVGGLGSITEDAYFALCAMERGIPFGWVDGFIREQSPFTVIDLLQQRRRWFCGLSAVSLDTQLKPSTRWTLRFCIQSWALGSVGVVFGILTALAFGTNAFPPWAMMNMAVCGGVSIGLYIVGALRNVIHSNLSWFRGAFVIASTAVAVLLLWPPILEGIAVFYAIVRPMKYFYIVRKQRE